MSSNSTCNGLSLLPDVCIEQLSGPAMLKIMYPNHASYPIVVLMGDVHARAEVCDPCEHQDGKGCYTLYDPAFLKQMDRIAETYPVDFFTESSHYHFRTASKKEKSQLLFQRFLSQLEKCHDTRFRGQQTDCPTQYIRWHRMDTRYDVKGVDSFLRISYRIIKELQHLDESDHRSVADILGPNASDVSLFIWSFLWMIRMDLENAQNIMIEFIWSKIDPKSVLFKQIRKAGENPADYKKLFADCFHSQFQMRLSDNQEDTLFLLSKIFENPTDPLPQNFKRLNSLTKDIRKIHTMEHALPITEYNQLISHRNTMDYLQDAFTRLSTILVDLYTFTRMRKLPKDNDRSVLSFCYFGSLHCSNLEFLLKARDYTEAFSMLPNQSPRRNCLTAPSSYDLHMIVTSLAKERYSNHPQLQEQYLSKIQSEQQTNQPSLPASSGPNHFGGRRRRGNYPSVKKMRKGARKTRRR